MGSREASNDVRNMQAFQEDEVLSANSGPPAPGASRAAGIVGNGLNVMPELNARPLPR